MSPWRSGRPTKEGLYLVKRYFPHDGECTYTLAQWYVDEECFVATNDVSACYDAFNPYIQWQYLDNKSWEGWTWDTP